MFHVRDLPGPRKPDFRHQLFQSCPFAASVPRLYNGTGHQGISCTTWLEKDPLGTEPIHKAYLYRRGEVGAHCPWRPHSRPRGTPRRAKWPGQQRSRIHAAWSLASHSALAAAAALPPLAGSPGSLATPRGLIPLCRPVEAPRQPPESPPARRARAQPALSPSPLPKRCLPSGTQPAASRLQSFILAGLHPTPCKRSAAERALRGKAGGLPATTSRQPHASAAELAAHCGLPKKEPSSSGRRVGGILMLSSPSAPSLRRQSWKEQHGARRLLDVVPLPACLPAWPTVAFGNRLRFKKKGKAWNIFLPAGSPCLQKLLHPD